MICFILFLMALYTFKKIDLTNKYKSLLLDVSESINELKIESIYM